MWRKSNPIDKAILYLQKSRKINENMRHLKATKEIPYFQGGGKRRCKGQGLSTW